MHVYKICTGICRCNISVGFVVFVHPKIEERPLVLFVGRGAAKEVASRGASRAGLEPGRRAEQHRRVDKADLAQERSTSSPNSRGGFLGGSWLWK